MEAVINTGINDKEIEELISDIRQSSAVKQALVEARNFAERGVAELEILPNNQARSAVIEVAYYIVDREL